MMEDLGLSFRDPMENSPLLWDSCVANISNLLTHLFRTEMKEDLRLTFGDLLKCTTALEQFKISNVYLKMYNFKSICAYTWYQSAKLESSFNLC